MAREFYLNEDGVFGPHDTLAAPETVVRTTAQNLSEPQKAQVRANIGAGTGSNDFGDPIAASAAVITGEYFDLGDGNLIPIYRVPPPPVDDDWVAGVGMYQDALATTPVTAAGQRLRAWKSPSGRTLLATQSGGMLVQNDGGTLTPYIHPNGNGLDHGGLELAGGIDAPSAAHMIVRSSAVANNFFLTDGAPRTNEVAQSNLLGFVYNGTSYPFSTEYLLPANAALLTGTIGHSTVELRRNGALLVSVAGAPYTFPMPLFIGKGGAGNSNGATFFKRIRIAPVASMTADAAALTATLPPLPATKIAIVSDSQFTCIFDSYIGGGINDVLAQSYHVLPNSFPGGSFSSVSDPNGNTAPILGFGPSKLIFCLTNDFAGGRTAAQLLSDITGYAATLGVANPIIVTPWPRGSNWGVLTEAQYTAECEAFEVLVVGTAGVRHVSGYSIINGVKRSSDGVHLTAAGRDALVAAIATFL